ncbi:hypothetical protein [Ideonella margarita]|uniref:Lipase (Class 3) n=1 Tax=Ideonella margarita TaxID=2984191 RepID=A0ABU9C175_9BURK
MTASSLPAPDVAAAPVRRRLVCYFSGFDPQGPGHYHQLFKDEAAKQSQVSGYALEVGPRKKVTADIVAWEVRGEFPDDACSAAVVDTRVEFLRWDDLIRAHWPRGRRAVLATVAWASWEGWRQGVLMRTLRQSWPFFLTIGAPSIWLALVLLSGLILALSWPGSGSSTAMVLFGAAVLTWACGLVGVAWWADKRMRLGWLLRSLAFIIRQGRGEIDGLAPRVQGFCKHVERQIRSGAFDEVIIVGHSSGAMLAMSVMAEALRSLRTAADTDGGDDAHPGCQLSLLTLGHCTPLLSVQPAAQWFRDDVSTLLGSKAVSWVDYAAPPDGCCFSLQDPSLGLQSATQSAYRPKCLNPRFAELFAGERYQAIRRDKFRCHFQYVMAGDLRSSYDYFAMTCGPRTLPQWHAHMPSVVGWRGFWTFGGPRL